MRRKSFTLTSLLVCLLVSSGMPAGSSGAQAHKVMPLDGPAAVSLPVEFPEPTWEPADDYIQIRQDGCPGYVRLAGAPLLPFWGRMIPFPVGTRIIAVGLRDAIYEEHFIDKKVLPAPEPVPLVPGASPVLREGPAYSAGGLYPSGETGFTVTTGMGESGRTEAHLYLKVFPVRYDPVNGLIRELKSGQVVVRYKSAPAPVPLVNESYDLLILAPPEFEKEMGRYKSHKEELGFSVRMVNLTAVYGNALFNVSSGRDNPEKIKLFIRAALENWSVRYVVLTGDVDKFPIRRACFLDYYDSSDLPTDLYYEDIYKAGTNAFCDWDKDRDNLFPECYPSTNPDAIDIDPDVTVGRMPAGTEAELRGMVDKTISYYENVSSGDWFRNVTLVGTDTFGPSRGETSGVAEGEYTCDAAFSYLNSSRGFIATRFYELNHTFSITGIRDRLDRGEGFAIFANHGATDGVCYPDSGGGPGLSSGTAATLTNGPRYPLSVLDACSTHAIDSNDCLGENLVLNPKGGSIASIGATRVAYGSWGTWHIAGNSGYINVHLSEAFSKGTVMPGVMLDRTKQSYMANVGIWDYADMKTMVQYIQLGDPVAFIGGAGTTASADGTVRWADPGTVAQFNLTIGNEAIHSDTVQLSLSGARWAAGLNTSQVVLPANTTARVNLRVNVDALADAYDSTTVTVSVVPRSTGIPVKLNLTTNVNCIRKISFSVNETRFSAFPGQNLSLGYSIQNEGNVFEKATMTVTGNDAGWKLAKAFDAVDIAKRAVHNGTLEIPVPERCLAGFYTFRLAMSTESGLSREVPFQVTVYKTYGFSARLLNADATAGVPGASFDIAVANLGNHPDSCELRLAGIPEMWSGESSCPADMQAFEEKVRRFTVRPDDRALAGDYPMRLELHASWGLLQTDVLVATVEKRSDLRLTVKDRAVSVDGGSDASISLDVESLSNFAEPIKLDLQRLPGGWCWFLASEPIEVGPFSNASGLAVLQVPEGCPAGHYTIDVVASTPAWKCLRSLSVEVSARKAFTARLDAGQAVMRPGDTRAFTLAIRNGGNCEDSYLLSSAGALPAHFPRNLPGIAGGASGDFPVVLTVPGTMRSGLYDISVTVSSASDPSLVRVVALQIRVEKITDLQIDVEKMSGASQGTSGVIWLAATNLGSEAETVTLSAPGLSAWELEFPELSIQPGQTAQVPVTYTVPAGIDGGTYLLVFVASGGDRSWQLEHQVSVPAPPSNTIQGSTSGSAPSLLPAMLGGICIITVLCAIALSIRSRRKKARAVTVQDGIDGADTAPSPAAPVEAPVPTPRAPEPQAPIPPPPPWHQPPG